MNLKVIVPSLAILAVVSMGAWYLSSDINNETAASSTDTNMIEVPAIVDTTNDLQLIKRTTEVIDEEPSEEMVKETPIKDKRPALAKVPSVLSESDIDFIQAVQNLAPKLVTWMTPDQQIRKWVYIIDNIADGNIPIQNRPLAYDMDKFQVDNSTEEGAFYLSGANFKRTELLINTFTQIPPAELVRYYQHWLPLLNKAYDELGRDDNFEDRLIQAIENVLAIQSLNEKVALKQPSVFYVYANKDLEKADKLHKFFWRLGSKNTNKAQTYLKKIEPLIN